MTLKIRSLASH